jgi:hypothetical protein
MYGDVSYREETYGDVSYGEEMYGDETYGDVNVRGRTILNHLKTFEVLIYFKGISF